MEIRCSCGKLIAKQRGGKIYLWCKQCHKEVELEVEPTNEPDSKVSP